MSMYFVGSTDGNGESLDLFVVADDIPTADKLWQTHYGIDPETRAALKPTVWKLSYHAFGPNAVIPWEKLERTDL